MRHAPKSDQEKLEIEAAERTDRRKAGFDLMKVRDRGSGSVRDHSGSEVRIYWHVNDDELEEGEVRWNVPDGMFILETSSRYYEGHPKYTKGVTLVFDKEEFMKWLRWV